LGQDRGLLRLNRSCEQQPEAGNHDKMAHGRSFLQVF
jgi:hypothetical protein